MAPRVVACIGLVAFLSLAGAESSAKCPFARHLLQASDDDSDDFGDLAEDVSVFQEASVSACSITFL